MREIKFRQYIPKVKAFHYWGLIKEGVFVGPMDKRFAKDSEQYTGLKDKNGKEIYEGDIVKTTSLVDEYSQRGATMTSPVEIWKGNACLTVTYVPIYPLCVNHIVEVIGNIYSNPELVEGVQ